MYGYYRRVTEAEFADLDDYYVHRQDAKVQDRLFHLDEGWQAIWYLLGRADAPLHLVMGRYAIGDPEEELIWYLNPAEVRQGAAYLATMPAERLLGFYDPETMTEANIYPDVWLDDDGEDRRAWLMKLYEGLPAFFAATAAAGQGLITAVEPEHVEFEL